MFIEKILPVSEKEPKDEIDKIFRIDLDAIKTKKQNKQIQRPGFLN